MNTRFKLGMVLSATALILAGCSSTSRNCVDKDGNIIPDEQCTRSTGGGVGAHYLYGGTRSGSRIVGGSTTAPSSTGTARSGFGGSSSIGG